jgi:hypothetical protein
VPPPNQLQAGSAFCVSAGQFDLARAVGATDPIAATGIIQAAIASLCGAAELVGSRPVVSGAADRQKTGAVMSRARAKSAVPIE